MKRTALILILLICCCLSPALCEQSEAVVRTGGARLGLRWMPLPSSSVVTYIPDGATVLIEAKQGDWCLVTYERKSGYVPAVFLANEPEEIGDAFIEEATTASGQAMRLSESRARDIADAALSRLYPDFLLSEYGIVQVSYREDTPDLGTYYGFEYFCEDGSRSYRCCVDAMTGSVIKLLPPQ